MYTCEDTKRSLGLKPVTRKKVNPPECTMKIPEEFIVTFSRGVHHCGGEGKVSESRTNETEIIKKEKHYRWEVFRGKGN